MKNINIKCKLSLLIGALLILLITGSCEKYLDKAPAATITNIDAFGNFRSFQGFVEQMYSCITDYSTHSAGNWYFTFQCADEVLSNSNIYWDDGNYWDQSYFLIGSVDLRQDPMFKFVWPLSWYGIRAANLGLTKLDLLKGTQEERDVIKGQCLFFRAFFHYDLIRFYGGMPYVDTLLSPTGPFNLPRLNYRESALKAAKDFQAAADLLPVRWDEQPVGQATLGSNAQRVDKVRCLSFLGKNLLYAASPMMNEESTGSNTYDAELCKQAAQAFAKVIHICDSSEVYKLQSWATYTDNFWVWSPGQTLRSGGTEVIMNPPVYQVGYTRWTMCRTSSPLQFNAGNSRVEVPTENYLHNFGMANGLPITDPLSGYDPANPWANRDPRFYVDIVTDGGMLVKSTAAGADQYAQLYNGGRHKSSSGGSVTGYFYRKYTPLGCNDWDKGWNNFQAYVPFMRLADVYLMYAEAVLQGYGTAQSSVTGSITAEQALNIVRNRAQLPNISATYTATKDAFMGEIIRERAVELAYESQRWFDLRRWNLAGDPKYLDKTALDYDRGPGGIPINMKERVVKTRVFDKRNNWLPIQVSYTKLYPGFQQNPGW